MNTMTKKDFKEKHAKKELKLVYSFWNCTKEEALDKLAPFSIEKIKQNLIALTRSDIGNMGEFCKVNIFETDIYVIVETIYDNSKNNQTSNNETSYNTIVYFKI